LNAALSKHASDDELSPSVLRHQLARHAAALRGTNPEHFMVTGPGLILVGGDADNAEMATMTTLCAMPTLDPSWFAHVAFGNFLGLDGTLTPLAELELVFGHRFFADQRRTDGPSRWPWTRFSAHCRPLKPPLSTGVPCAAGWGDCGGQPAATT